MSKVFITREIPEAGVSMLREALGADAVDMFDTSEFISRDELLKRVKGVEAIYSILTETIDGEVLDAAGPQVKIVANMAVGYNNVDVKACTERGIPVTNTPGVLTETTADLTWALLLATARRTGESERYLREKKWKGWGPLQFVGADVYGKTLGIYGMGRIGQATARRALGFGMRVIYASRSRIDGALEAELKATHVDKDTLLAESDYLSIHCPYTPETHHLFKAEDFAKMKKSATVINTARGPIVDEAALVAALKGGVIARAGLDVFEEEPKIHPGLFELEEAVLLPHIGSATIETRSKMATMAAENVIARLKGERPPNCVNPETLTA